MSTTVRVQAVICNNNVANLERSLESIAAATRFARSQIPGKLEVHMAYGDASPQPNVDADTCANWKRRFESSLTLEYHFFNENTGFGKGNNMLAEGARADFLFVINPDIVLAPTCLFQLVTRALSDSTIGTVEARQSPIELPKEYNPKTGDTDWTSGACTLIRANAFKQLGGYDHETFFMYCEDVDLAWRMRTIGLHNVYCPLAIAFHPKDLLESGAWAATETSDYHGALSDLSMGFKWNNPDFSARVSRHLLENGSPAQRKAVKDFYSLLERDNMRSFVQDAERYSSFKSHNYARHRFEFSVEPARERVITTNTAQEVDTSPWLKDEDEVFLSVVVFAPVGANELERFIELATSLQAQSCANFEIIIATNPTKAGTLGANDVKIALASFPAQFSRKVRFLELDNSTNCPKEIALHAQGRYLTQLQTGDVPLDNWVYDLIQASARFPKAILHTFALAQPWNELPTKTSVPALRSIGGIVPWDCRELQPSSTPESTLHGAVALPREAFIEAAWSQERQGNAISNTNWHSIAERMIFSGVSVETGRVGVLARFFATDTNTSMSNWPSPAPTCNLLLRDTYGHVHSIKPCISDAGCNYVFLVPKGDRTSQLTLCINSEKPLELLQLIVDATTINGERSVFFANQMSTDASSLPQEKLALPASANHFWKTLEPPQKLEIVHVKTDFAALATHPIGTLALKGRALVSRAYRHLHRC